MDIRIQPPPERRTVDLGNGVTAVLIRVPAGTVVMGSPETEDGRWQDERQRVVEIPKPFWIWETPVTQAQWQALMGNNPAYFKGADLPVESVSWHDCQEFNRRLTALLAAQFQDFQASVARLPTEEQWEYACRAGTTGPINVPGATVDQVAWHAGNSGGKTHPVKQKLPNPWGLYDMLGNVSEWCDGGVA